jgi:GT2 family glycosyltransferase
VTPTTAFAVPDAPRVSVIVLGWRDAPLLMACLRSLRDVVRRVESEVIVALNEPSAELRAVLARCVSGVTTLTSRSNLGFGGAINVAATHARGEYLVLLNDDTEVLPEWLEALVETADAQPQCGAVGSRLLFPDGSVQEAGSVVWSDGSTYCVGTGLPKESRQWMWARQVHYCSGGSLLVRRSTWERLGGFDDRYYPAYYEDVDLCLRIKEAGEQVWYQPASMLTHVRSASTNSLLRSFIFERNRQRLIERWQHVLSQRVAPHLDNVRAAVWHGMGSPERVLVIDDRIPDQSLGSGYGRMVDCLDALARDGRYHVALYPTATSEGDVSTLGRLGVEVVEGSLEDHLREPGVDYEHVIISRPHNFRLLGATVRKMLGHAHLVYDAEAMYHRRIERQAVLEPNPELKNKLLQEAGAMRETESEVVGQVDDVICISEEEAALVRPNTTARVSVVSAWLSAPQLTTRDFRERAHLGLVAGWLAGPSSPNADGLLWFVRHVLPLVRVRVPWARLLVTGASPPANVLRLAGPDVVFVGGLPDLHSFYDSIRVAVVPVRYGAGVKLKTVEALQHGVPTVSTVVGAEGIDEEVARSLVISDSPSIMAEALALLVDDPTAWARRRARIVEASPKWAASARGTSWSDVVSARECATGG